MVEEIYAEDSFLISGLLQKLFQIYYFHIYIQDYAYVLHIYIDLSIKVPLLDISERE